MSKRKLGVLEQERLRQQRLEAEGKPDPVAESAKRIADEHKQPDPRRQR